MAVAHDLLERFIVSDSGMYEDLGMRTRHVLEGSREVVFWMELRDVLQVENVLWVPRVCSQPQRFRCMDM